MESVLRKKGSLRWGGFVKELVFQPVVKEWGSYGWWEWRINRGRCCNRHRKRRIRVRETWMRLMGWNSELLFIPSKLNQRLNITDFRYQHDSSSFLIHRSFKCYTSDKLSSCKCEWWTVTIFLLFACSCWSGNCHLTKSSIASSDTEQQLQYSRDKELDVW